MHIGPRDKVACPPKRHILAPFIHHTETNDGETDYVTIHVNLRRRITSRDSVIPTPNRLLCMTDNKYNSEIALEPFLLDVITRTVNEDVQIMEGICIDGSRCIYTACSEVLQAPGSPTESVLKKVT